MTLPLNLDLNGISHSFFSTTYYFKYLFRLRALSHGDTAVSPPPSPSLGASRYKLAQHRYGREEMLALYDKMMKAPDDLTVAPPLFIEKTQLPLALTQTTDEEMVRTHLLLTNSPGLVNFQMRCFFQAIIILF